MDACEYIEAAASQIRSRRARDMVAKELEAHIEDQAAYCREQGMSEEEANLEAVRQMGDPVEVGISMDRIHRPQTDWKMVLMLVLLCVLGLCLQIALNRDVRKAEIASLLESGTVVSQDYLLAGVSRSLLVTLCSSLILGILVCIIDYTVILRYMPWFICLMLMILGIQALLMGYRLVIPVYAYYLLVPLYASLLYRYRSGGFRGFAGGMLLLVLMLVIMGILKGAALALYGYSGLRFCFVLAVTLSVAVLCGWYGEQKRGKLLFLWGGGLLLFCMAVQYMLLKDGFKGQRIRAILHPYDYAGEGGYYVVMVRGWLGRCTLWGNPEAASQYAQGYRDVYLMDAYFSPDDGNILYLFLRYGIVPGIIVCLIFLGCIGYFMYRCLRQKNQLGRVTGAGCCIVFLTEFCAYMMSNLGLLPWAAGLPFLSYGRIDIEIWAVLMGFVFSIIRYQHLLPAERVGKKPRYRYRLKIEKVTM